MTKITEKLCQFAPIRWLHDSYSSRTSGIRNQTLMTRAIPVDIKMDSIRQERQQQQQGGSHNNASMDTELHVAAFHGNIGRAHEVVTRSREMLWCGDAQGNLPLHLAVQNGHTDVASYLAGEYPHGSYALNHRNISPLHLAVDRQKMELVECMLHMIKYDHQAINVIQSNLLNHSSIVNAAINSGNLRMLQVMLKNRSTLMEGHDGEGWTPLSYAAYHGYVPMVDFFLKNYPKLVTKRNMDSSYPTHKACQGGHIDVLEKLYSHSPKSFTWSDKHGRTILHVAAKEPKNKLVHVVSYLLNLDRHEINRALLVGKDENFKTPLELAKYSKNDQVARIITLKMG